MVALLLLLALSLSASLAAASATTPERPALQACAHPAAQPMSWEHEGRMHGVCVEVARRAFASAGWTLNVAPAGPWPRCQAMVQRGQLDAMVCAFDTPARREYAVPLEPALASNEGALFVRRDSPLQFEGWADLAGWRIGVGRGVSLGAGVDAQLARQAQVENALGEEQNLRKLLLGRLEAVATARESGEQLLQVLGCERAVRVLPRSLGAAPLYLQVSRQSPVVAALPQVSSYLQRPEYAAELRSLRQEQAALYRRQNPPRDVPHCER